jgi:hypothetical protein
MTSRFLSPERGGTAATGTERMIHGMQESTSAERFVEELEAHRSPEKREKYRRYFKTGDGEYGEGDVFIGVRMGQVFALAREFIDMPPEEIEKLLESPVHEVRAGALSIMDKQGRSKKTPEVRRKELFDLYLRRADTIGNWDLVDLASPTWSDATSSTSRATSSTSWRAPRMCGNAGPPSSPPRISSGKAT